MLRILLLLGFIFYSFPSLAKIVNAKVKYMHTGEISANEGCELAKNRAKLKALEKVIGQTITSEELEKCSQIDGKSNCERNQFFLSSFNGVLTGLKELARKKTTKPLDGEVVYYCEVEIKANVEPIKQIKDPNFNFNVKLNKYNFNSEDNLTMEIGFTKPMYLTIFQWQPYIEKNYQVNKLFPNPKEEDNYIKDEKITLPYNIDARKKLGISQIKVEYKVSFPENINKKNIEEFLFFITSDENIEWLDEYNNIYELKSSYINSTKRVKTKYKQYTIYK